MFHKIFLICPTYAEDKNWSYFDAYVNSGKVEVLPEVTDNKLSIIWNWCRVDKNAHPDHHYMIYFDDCTGQPAFKTNQEKGVVNQICSKGNHSNISTIFVVQKFTQASTIMRANAETFITFFTQSDTEKDAIYKEFGCGKKRDFKAMMDHYTEEPYDYLYINRQGPGMADYYHNFKKIKFNANKV